VTSARTRRAWGALLLAVLVGGGCSTSRIGFEELPEAPIALTWWDAEDARRLQEALNPERLPPGVDLRELQEQALARTPGRLYLLDPRTRELERVAAAPPGARALAFSPDHRRLLFRSDVIDGRSQIYEVDLADGELLTLTHGSPHLHADYVPDGLVLMRQGERGGTAAILQASPSGGGARALYETAASDSLRASADGRSLAWEQVRPGPGATRRARQPFVVVAEAGGDEEVRALAPGRDPVFHPEGWIVYTAPSAASWQLRRIRPDGTGRAPLGPVGAAAESPAISPDGRYVVYVGSDSLGAKLYVRRFDGTGERVLLSNGMTMAPVW